MEDRIAHYMVTFTAKQWPEAYRRALEVEELPKKGSQRMAAAVTAAAARLGYKQRNFFKIIRAYKESLKQTDQVLSKYPRQLPNETRAALEEAIANAGPGARPGAIHSAAEALCKERNINPPSGRAVRTRLNLPAEITDVVAYTGTNTDYALDMSPLDVAVDGPNNTPYRAVLTAFIDARHGNVIAHTVTVGRPMADDLLHLFTEAVEKTKPKTPSPASLVIYRGAPINDPRLKVQMRLLGISEPDIQVDARRPGLPLTALFGTKLGRVAVNPRSDPSNPYAVDESLPLHVVRPAIALLLERHHAGLQVNREIAAIASATTAVQAVTKGPQKSNNQEFTSARLPRTNSKNSR